MIFYVGNKITVENPTADLRNWCNENLVLDNPEYFKKERMGLWLGNTVKRFALYEQDSFKIILPYGCITDIIRRYPGNAFISRQNAPRNVFYNADISLYGYQENALKKALSASHGVIVMPCGAGKTQVGLALIDKIGGKALWLTHTQDLLSQSLNRAKSIFNCDNKFYGTITGGKVNIGSGITFATVQTMAKLDLAQYRDCWDIVVVDECHRAIGSPTKVMQFYKVLSNLSCKHKYGLTATPKRSDGLEKAMFALIGNVICEVSKEDVAHTTCPVSVEFYNTGYSPDFDVVLAGDGTINYASLIGDLIENKNRFNYILEMLNKSYVNDGAMLILGNRVEYLKKLNDAFEGKSVCLSGMGTSKKAKAERKEVLRRLNCGQLNAVFATYQLAAEGLDCPNLRYVVFATPEKNERIVEQASGRVARKSDGKSYGTVIDFVDDFGMYKGWAKKRKSVYKKLGYAII